jgi:glucosamine--fructose-6-phosphate aminotransferase (isomerizing)
VTNIFGVLNDNNVAPSLLNGLLRLQLGYGDFDWVSIATLMEGRIQHQQIGGNFQDLTSLLQKQPIYGRFGIACTRQKCHNKLGRHNAYLCATKQVAIAHHGFIENIRDIRKELLKFGYEFNTATDGEVILRLLHRYLDMGLSPIEASVVTLARLEGYFATIALFANQPDLLVATRRGCSLAIGANENRLYIGSDTNALSLLGSQVMRIEEGSPVVLRSVKTTLTNFPIN